MTLIVVDSGGITADVWATRTDKNGTQTEVDGFRKVFPIQWVNDHPLTQQRTLHNAYAFTGNANAFLACMEGIDFSSGRLSINAVIAHLKQSGGGFRFLVPTTEGCYVITAFSSVMSIKHTTFENPEGGMDTLYFGGITDHVGRTSDPWIGVFLDVYRDGKLPSLDYVRLNFYSGDIIESKLLNDEEAKGHRQRRLYRSRRARTATQ